MIKDFELIDHGIDHNQYFRGCGVSGTKFEFVTTGAGENALEAFDDALEQIAMSESVDLSLIENSREYKKASTKKSQKFTVMAFHRRNGNLVPKREKNGNFTGEYEEFENEHYYYISIRYNLFPRPALKLAEATP